MIESSSIHIMDALQVLLGFTYYYPLFMAYLWILGAFWFYLRYEFRQQDSPQLTDIPKVSIVVPCFNEEAHVSEVIAHLQKMAYPDFEIIAVNDGSNDRTGIILDDLAQHEPRLRVLHHVRNQGKSIGLSTAAYLADSEYIIGIDGDALLDHPCYPLVSLAFSNGVTGWRSNWQSPDTYSINVAGQASGWRVFFSGGINQTRSTGIL